MNLKVVRSTLLTLLLASGQWLLPGAGICADLSEEAVALVRNNRRSPREMQPFAEKLANLPADKRQELARAMAPYLRSPSWQEQANAIYLLGYLGESAAQAVPDIIKASDASMSNVAWEAGPALARIGAPAVAPLILAIKAEPPGVLSRRIYNLMSCVKALGPKGAALAPYVVPFLGDGHNSGAIAALVAMGPACLPAVCQGFESDPRGLITVHAGYVFEKFGSASSKSIVSYLNGKCSALGKKNAVYALAKLKPAPEKEAAAVLCRIMAEADSATLENAALALTAIGPAAAPDVLELSSNKDQAVSARVQKILRTYGGDRTAAGASVNVLVNKLDGADVQEAARAAVTVLKLAPGNARASAKLRELLSSDKPGARSTALRALPEAQAGGRSLLPDLLKILRDGESGDRALAADALGAIGPGAAAAVGPLIEAASIAHPIVVTGREGFDVTANIHESAVIALGKIGGAAAPALPLFCRLLKEPSALHKDVYVALGQMGPAALPALPTVLACLKSSTGSNERDEQEAILNLLIKLGPAARAALPALRELAENGPAYLRQKAFEALQAVEPDAAKTVNQTKALLKDSDFRLQEAALKYIVKNPALAKDGEISAYLSKGLGGNNYAQKQLCLEVLARSGSADDSLLPGLIKDNIGCSYSQPQKDRAFSTIKKMDPTGKKTIPLLQKALNDSFQVRGAVGLLEYIGSAESVALAKETRTRWKLK